MYLLKVFALVSCTLFCSVSCQDYLYSQNSLYAFHTNSIVSPPYSPVSTLLQPPSPRYHTITNAFVSTPPHRFLAPATIPVATRTTITHEFHDNSLDQATNAAVEEAAHFVEQGEVESYFNSSGFGTQHYQVQMRGHGSHGMGGHNYCKFTPTTMKLGKISNVNIKAYDIMTRRFGVPKSQAVQMLAARLPYFCTRERRHLQCDAYSRYRTVDGTCNNLQNPYWGAAFTAFDRLSPAVYEDGWNEPRGAGKSIHNSRLPNARMVSLNVHPDHVNPDNRMTNMVPQIGQFLDHDMTLTPESDKRCCSNEANNVDCWPIKLSTDDYFFSRLRHPQTCMDFTRSTPFCFPLGGATPGVREQFNIITGFVDASHVYSSEDHRIRILRSFQGGRLRVNSQNSNFLPTVSEVQAITGEKFMFMGTFLAGEERVNEMPALAVMHTLWFREHNRLADEIAVRRPYWDDETIFQEARRILIAEWQNIIYGQYLPVILGDRTMVRYNLKLDDNNLFSQYNPSLNPSVFHAFADAAYRFGHTLINGLIRLMRGLSDIGQYRIRDNFFSPEQLGFNGGEGYDLILGGLMAQNSQTYDPFITEDVTNFLLREKEHDFGGDLIARNLQRARDHGLPAYNVYRQICGMQSMTNSWEHRPSNIPQNVWQVLASMYETPADIDLFTGGLAEVPVPDGVTGHTMNCLKALQFSRAKFGDRFFFTHLNQAGSFTPEQIREIRKRTLGDVICQNSNVEMTTMNVFKMPSAENPMVFCRDPIRANFNIEIFLYDRV